MIRGAVKSRRSFEGALRCCIAVSWGIIPERSRSSPDTGRRRRSLPPALPPSRSSRPASHRCAGELACAVSDITCAVSELTCVISDITCAISKLTCVISKLTCVISDITCVISKITCAISKLTCAISKLTCATGKLTCAVRMYLKGPAVCGETARIFCLVKPDIDGVDKGLCRLGKNAPPRPSARSLYLLDEKTQCLHAQQEHRRNNGPGDKHPQDYGQHGLPLTYTQDPGPQGPGPRAGHGQGHGHK